MVFFDRYQPAFLPSFLPQEEASSHHSVAELSGKFKGSAPPHDAAGHEAVSLTSRVIICVTWAVCCPLEAGSDTVRSGPVGVMGSSDPFDEDRRRGHRSRSLVFPSIPIRHYLRFGRYFDV